MASAPADAIDSQRRPIGGFPAVFLGFLALGLVFGAVADASMLKARSAALPLVLVNAVVLVWTGYALVLGVTKDPRFPANARDILIVAIVQLVVFFESWLNLGAIGVSVLWIVYLRRSDRVRRTYDDIGPVRAGAVGLVDRLRANLMSSPLNVVLTVLAVDLVAVAVPPVVRWGVVDAIWNAPNGAACRGPGACWAFIAEKCRFILFGFFPANETWRPVAVVAVFLAMILFACDRRSWGRRLASAWAAGLAAVFLLMHGGFLGLSEVETRLWSGLPLTLILAVLGMVFGFPLGILLALGRRSRLPAVRAVCVAYIELVRGVPLITVLFMASVMLPLFLPTGLTVDVLLRAQVAFILFAAAYLAEVVRGGLQAVPRGQAEAADALGLSAWQRTRLIVLPQALALVIPPLVNTFIGIFKDTALVIIISLFDLLNTAETALSDVNWQGFYVETYVFIGVIYWSFCFFMSRYSRMLEREFNRGGRR